MLKIDTSLKRSLSSIKKWSLLCLYFLSTKNQAFAFASLYPWIKISANVVKTTRTDALDISTSETNAEVQKITDYKSEANQQSDHHLEERDKVATLLG